MRVRAFPMKKSRKFELAFIGLTLLGSAGFAAYECWPLLLPHFMPGQCVQHATTKRVYLLEHSNEATYEIGVQALVLVRGYALRDEHQVGTRERIQLHESGWRRIPCPP